MQNNNGDKCYWTGLYRLTVIVMKSSCDIAQSTPCSPYIPHSFWTVVAPPTHLRNQNSVFANIKMVSEPYLLVLADTDCTILDRGPARYWCRYRHNVIQKVAAVELIIWMLHIFLLGEPSVVPPCVHSKDR